MIMDGNELNLIALLCTKANLKLFPWIEHKQAGWQDLFIIVDFPWITLSLCIYKVF